ncbi:Hypothetical predicted protein [Marmota monax]|uniref:Uncharacterized protein n=1 Tax=Marmota monax TaxID=9995 RepID=A0A5E4D0S4_MARMO|nr:Hypothetical predicted protein [Marmota monax]
MRKMSQELALLQTGATQNTWWKLRMWGGDSMGQQEGKAFIVNSPPRAHLPENFSERLCLWARGSCLSLSLAFASLRNSQDPPSQAPCLPLPEISPEAQSPAPLRDQGQQRSQHTGQELLKGFFSLNFMNLSLFFL